EVVGTVRSSSDEATARKAGAHEVVLSDQELATRVRRLAPEGMDHIVEVAFGANIENDLELLKMGGSIATYATDSATPKIPFWQLVFKNIRVFFLGSDDFPKDAKMLAAQDLNRALEAGGRASRSANESRSQILPALMNLQNTRFDGGGL